MKKILGKILCLFLILALLTTLVGCGMGIEFDFSRFFPTQGGAGDGGQTPGGQTPEGQTPGEETSGESNSGVIDISGGTLTEWGVGGYVINTTVEDTVPKVVASYAEANALIDVAIMSHLHSLTIDYSAVEGYSPAENNIEIELSNHVRIEKRYYESNPTVVEFVISYEETAASEVTPLTEENDRYTVITGNFLARLASIPDEERRGAAFDAFSIDSVDKTCDVYNSEELWYALAHGFRPTFPLENSKAERFYLEAKRILRYIVTDSMTDYEKLLSIYEYLVDAVEYDYDTFYADSDGSWHGKNVCYYLEGVFETGRAVCDGKAKALVLFLAIEGIECVRDFGKKLDTGVGHAWNYVKLDGVWYLVDTTSGDRSLDGDVGEFIGGVTETINYSHLLLPVDYYVDTYAYSPTHLSITDGASDYEFSFEHLALGLYDGTEYDFVIDRSGELSAICELALGAANDITFSLTVKYNRFVGIQTEMYSIMRDKDYEYAIFVLNEADREYLVIFKTEEASAG